VKNIHRIVISLVVIGILLIPSGFALADQAFQTLKVPFYTAPEANPSVYPLKDGFVESTHMNGPNYFEKKEFQLHGAKPNTRYFIWRVFPDGLGPYPPGKKLDSGFSFMTDEHGNGHIMTWLVPDNPSLKNLKALHINEARLYNVLSDGWDPISKVQIWHPAYQTDTVLVYFDWKWTP
jgi:hypothetical protein